MIYIVGKVTYIAKNYIYLETNFMGRKVLTKENENVSLNKIMKFYTSQIVVETSKGQSFEQIYGFLNFSDFVLFNKLITLPSIGPKTAINLLSNNSELITKLITNKDLKGLSALKGISEKVAKVIISNLSDLFYSVSSYDDKELKVNQNSNKNELTKNEVSNEVIVDEKKFIEIIDSLRSLGYSKDEIEYGINKLDENKYSEFNVEDILADIIKNISSLKFN
ncbi:MAG: hypothetical protein IIT97_00205 [Mycoplasmataceae bacterium]|nr:hypothetical protein [Mycoplasmataceae bacterium]MBQ5543349.1 hypothetical protein [Mycoplasmataceae bacterium]